VVVSLGITALFKDFSSLRWLSVFVLLMIGVWIVAVRYAGKHFRSMTDPA
jgi:ATP/ADP translocase